MLLKDAGVLRYSDAGCTIEFPPPPPEQPVVKEVVVSKELAGRVTGTPPAATDNYDRLFGGNKPRLNRSPEQ